MSHLALVHRALGHLEKCIQIDEEVLEISERLLSPDDPDIGSSLNNLACGYVYHFLALQYIYAHSLSYAPSFAISRTCLTLPRPSIAVVPTRGGVVQRNGMKRPLRRPGKERENGDFNKKSKFLNVHQRKNLR
jgi:hypothetical protein